MVVVMVGGPTGGHQIFKTVWLRRCLKVLCCSKLPDTMEEALNLGKKSMALAAADVAKQGSVNRAMEDEEEPESKD